MCAQGLELVRQLGAGRQLLGQVLGQPVGDVDPEAVHPAVRPEAQRGQELLVDLRVGPVEVRLLAGEQVQVPLPRGAVRLGDARPGRAAENGGPVRRRQLAVLASALPEDVAGALGAARPGGQRLLEPHVLIRAVVGHDVDDDLDLPLVQGRDELVEVLEGAQTGVDVAVVGDVVAAVGQLRGIERAQPHGIHSQVPQVVRATGHAAQVPQAVAVGVLEAARIDLVDDRLPPPVRRAPEGVRLRCLGGGDAHRISPSCRG